jgi:hypothetical protein
MRHAQRLACTVKDKEKENMRCACKSLHTLSLLVCSHIAAAGGSPEQTGRRNEAAGKGGWETDHEKIFGQSVINRLSCATGIERLSSSK